MLMLMKEVTSRCCPDMILSKQVQDNELGSVGRHLLNWCLLACDYSTVVFDIFVMT